MISEGREGRGWSCFAAELIKVKAFFDSPVGKGTPTMAQRQPSGDTLFFGDRGGETKGEGDNWQCSPFPLSPL
jgi:hypothetical protein